jgi:hypothetical protein
MVSMVKYDFSTDFVFRLDIHYFYLLFVVRRQVPNHLRHGVFQDSSGGGTAFLRIAPL